jgi:hypothetical protein
MTESEYWLRLEFRLCLEFAGLREKRFRYLGCDGFIPQQYLLDEPPPCIIGNAWICIGQESHELWMFTLFLDDLVHSRSEIDWAALLPPDNVTRWLAFDQLGKCLEIDPSAAVPDLTT